MPSAFAPVVPDKRAVAIERADVIALVAGVAEHVSNLLFRDYEPPLPADRRGSGAASVMAAQVLPS